MQTVGNKVKIPRQRSWSDFGVEIADNHLAEVFHRTSPCSRRSTTRHMCINNPYSHGVECSPRAAPAFLGSARSQLHLLGTRLVTLRQATCEPFHKEVLSFLKLFSFRPTSKFEKLDMDLALGTEILLLFCKLWLGSWSSFLHCVIYTLVLCGTCCCGSFPKVRF